MKYSDVASLAWTNLKRQKLRTFLTMFGVLIGAGAIVLLISLGSGLERAVLKAFQVAELLNMITVLPAKVSFSVSSIFSRSFEEVQPKTLDDAVVTKLKDIPGVQTAYPNIASWADCSLDEKKSYSLVWGLPLEGISEGLKSYIVAGEFWKEEGNYVVLCSSIAKRFEVTDLQSLVGKNLVFSGFTGFRPPGMRARPQKNDKDESKTAQHTLTCTIVGVFESKSLGPFGDRILVPFEVAKTVRSIGIPAMSGMSDLDNEGSYGTITVRVNDPAQVEAVRRRIEELGYGTVTGNDIADTIGTIFLLIKAVLGCIGGVGMLVAFFGIVNTMFMAILERTKEIGIMKAMGARDFDIWSIFIGEAATIGFIGSLLGLACAWGVGELLDLIARRYIMSQGGPGDTDLFFISLPLAGGVIAFSVIVGVVAGLYPAARAARLAPVAALRRE